MVKSKGCRPNIEKSLLSIQHNSTILKRSVARLPVVNFLFALLQGENVSFEPKSKHLGIVRNLKTTVEGNFVAKHGAT